MDTISALAHPSRRRFLLGAGALFATPAIVRVASIMPVSVAQAHSFWDCIVYLDHRPGCPPAMRAPKPGEVPINDPEDHYRHGLVYITYRDLWHEKLEMEQR
jgi:hypothetical protein